MGTAVGTDVFTKYGWRPAAALSLAWTGFCLFILLIRGPHCSRYTWLGYEGGLRLTKVPLQKPDVEKAQQTEVVDVHGLGEKSSLQERDVVQEDGKVTRYELEEAGDDNRSEDSASTKRNP